MKGKNTRKEITQKEEVFFHLLIIELKNKIAGEWSQKYSQFGESFEDCIKKEKVNSFLKNLEYNINLHIEYLKEQKDIDSSHAPKSPSKSTFQRLLGLKKNDSSFLNDNTKNVLAWYLGFNSWADFVLYHQKPVLIVIQNQEEHIRHLPTKLSTYLPIIIENTQIGHGLEKVLWDFFFPNILSRRNPKKRWVWFVLFLLPLFHGFYHWLNLPINFSKSDLENIVFKIDTIQGISNRAKTVLVNYDVSHLKVKNVKVDFVQTIDMNYPNYKESTKKKDSFSYIYYRPFTGYIRLLVDGQEVKKILVKIPFKDWVGVVATYSEEGKLLCTNGIRKSAYIHDNKLHFITSFVPKEQLHQYISDFCYLPYKDLNIDADNCTIEFRVKNPEKEGGLNGLGVNFVINAFNAVNKQITFNSSLNSYWNQFSVGNTHFDVHINADKELLRKLAWDFDDWKTIRIQTYKDTVKVWKENNLLLKKKYEGKVGKIHSLSFSFLGSGSVDYIKVWNKNAILYNENFDD